MTRKITQKEISSGPGSLSIGRGSLPPLIRLSPTEENISEAEQHHCVKGGIRAVPLGMVSAVSPCPQSALGILCKQHRTSDSFRHHPDEFFGLTAPSLPASSLPSIPDLLQYDLRQIISCLLPSGSTSVKWGKHCPRSLLV